MDLVNEYAEDEEAPQEAETIAADNEEVQRDLVEDEDEPLSITYAMEKTLHDD